MIPLSMLTSACATLIETWTSQGSQCFLKPITDEHTMIRSTHTLLRIPHYVSGLCCTILRYLLLPHSAPTKWSGERNVQISISNQAYHWCPLASLHPSAFCLPMLLPLVTRYWFASTYNISCGLRSTHTLRHYRSAATLYTLPLRYG